VIFIILAGLINELCLWLSPLALFKKIYIFNSFYFGNCLRNCACSNIYSRYWKR
jgi:hypothetical protein